MKLCVLRISYNMAKLILLLNITDWQNEKLIFKIKQDIFPKVF